MSTPTISQEEGQAYPMLEEGPQKHAHRAASRARPRPLIIHYHLFKNAGTSLDGTLRANFRASWNSFEGSGPELSVSELQLYLLERPWITVLSSHKAVLPPPRLPGAEIIPILFIRHPLDRVRSVYDFEVKQQADTDGARAAKVMDFPEYVRWRLDRKGDRAIADFQTHRLAKGGQGPNELQRAMNGLETLSFVGLVEDYEKSLERLQALLVEYFPPIELTATHLNVTRTNDLLLEDRLNELEERLGAALFSDLLHANQNDLVIWEKCCEDYR